MIDVGTDFNVVAPVPLMRWKVEVGKTLHSARQSIFVQVVIAPGRLGCQNVGSISLRCERDAVLVYAESGFEQRPAAEIVLIFERADVGGFRIGGCGWLRL